MNQKTLFLVVGVLTGVVALYLLTRTGTKSPVTGLTAPATDSSQAPAPSDAPRRVVVARPSQPKTTPRTATSQMPPAPLSAWARLAQKYGSERTDLSSKITSNLTSVINQGMELANAAASNSGADSVAQAASKEMVRAASGQLGLSDQQQQQAAVVLQSALEKRMAAVTDLAHAMVSEPEPIMELFLAGDALARNEITREEYDLITEQTRTMLQNLSGFVGGRLGAGGPAQLLQDPETSSQLNAILTPDQQVKLAGMAADFEQQVQDRRAARGSSGTLFQGGQVPVMELERLDQSMVALKQMTDAAQLMMGAMKDLRDANPSQKKP